jgi:hypothetical protein
MTASYTTLPALPDTFRWTEEPWGTGLRCRPLEAYARHVFTTRQLALSTSGDWRRLAAGLGAEGIVTATQVHGRGVVVATEAGAGGIGEGTGERCEGDVLVSGTPGVGVAVRAADCVPLLLADPKSGGVAAVHAGWRGTAAGAPAAGVEALVREFGARPRDVVAAIGPSIGACCYEVGPDLVDAFIAAGHPRASVSRWFMTPAYASKPRLDLWAASRDQLIAAGLREENVHGSGLCTASHVELFPSYRVERERAGRLAGLIVPNAGLPNSSSRGA